MRVEPARPLNATKRRGKPRKADPTNALVEFVRKRSAANFMPLRLSKLLGFQDQIEQGSLAQGRGMAGIGGKYCTVPRRRGDSVGQDSTRGFF